MLQNTGAIPFRHIPYLPKFLHHYTQKPENFQALVNFLPNSTGLFDALQARKAFPTNRKLLVNTLLHQHTTYPEKELYIKKLLEENSYTVTTGHQLCLFSGPLYVIYKILSVIKLARWLNAHQSNCTVLPVFWMAGEDHDFEEINHVEIFSKKIQWKSDAIGNAVGRLSTQGILEALQAAGVDLGRWHTYYTGDQSYAQSTRALLYALFENFPELIILDPDDAGLKASARHIWMEELSATVDHEELLKKAEILLHHQGFEPQIHSRQTNLFYLGGPLRDRIVKNETFFSLAHQPEKQWSLKELCALIEQKPQDFSPNVVLRPLYQEYILPNIAYVGGPSEIHYWVQLKFLFEKFNLFYPVILPRASAILINKNTGAKILKWQLDVSYLLQPEHLIKKDLAEKWAQDKLDFHTEKELLTQLIQAVKTKAQAIDQTLLAWVEAEKINFNKILDKIEHKLIKAAEHKTEDSIQQILHLKNKLFPNQSMQERKENIFTYLLHNPEIIVQLYPHLDPLDFTCKIFTETN